MPSGIVITQQKYVDKTETYLGDQCTVFTNANSGGLIVHQPATNQHIAVAEFR